MAAKIVVIDPGPQLLANALALTFKEQLQAGIDENGKPLPPGIDLRETGALLNSIRGRVIDGEPYAEVAVLYAPYVLKRFRCTSLCPEYLKILETRWTPILSQYAVYLE